MDITNCFCHKVDRRKCVKHSFKTSSSNVLTIANLRHMTSRIGTCADRTSWLYRIKMDHQTMVEFLLTPESMKLFIKTCKWELVSVFYVTLKVWHLALQNLHQKSLADQYYLYKLSNEEFRRYFLNFEALLLKALARRNNHLRKASRNSNLAW